MAPYNYTFYQFGLQEQKTISIYIAEKADPKGVCLKSTIVSIHQTENSPYEARGNSPILFLSRPANIFSTLFRETLIKASAQSEGRDLISGSLNMEQHGIYQWDKLYPTEEDILNDIANGELYIGKVEDRIAVIYVINTSYDVEYNNGDWQYPNAEYRIIHRLCVHPEYQQKGIAKMTMQYIENEIR